MFKIRIFTPAVVNDDGWPHAGGELVVGDARMCFLVDLTHWSVTDYQAQWRHGVTRLLQGAPSTALMSAYRGPGQAAHSMWALWRKREFVYVQDHSVIRADLDAPFDPHDAYAHVGGHVPSAENALPIPEWRVEFEHLQAAMLGIRLPRYPS